MHFRYDYCSCEPRQSLERPQDVVPFNRRSWIKFAIDGLDNFNVLEVLGILLSENQQMASFAFLTTR